MKKEVNINNIVNYSEYGRLHNISNQRVYQLIKQGRLTKIVINKKKFVDKTETIKPSPAFIKAAKKMKLQILPL